MGAKEIDFEGLAPGQVTDWRAQPQDDLVREEGRLEAWDGERLFWQLWAAPEGQPRRGRVMLQHGYGEHSWRYDHVARALVRAGYDVMALDARGHGRSSGKRGFVERFDDYVKDLALLRKELDRRLPPERGPLFVLGHSQGGLIVLRYALEQPADVAAFAVTSPLCRIGAEVPAWKAVMGKLMSKAWPTLSLPTELDAADLTHVSEVVQLYRDDPLVLKIATARWFTEQEDAQQDLLRRAGEIRSPFLFIIAGADRIVDPAASEQVYHRLGSPDRELEMLPEAFHEVLNERDWTQTVRRLVGWFERHRTAAEG